MIPVGAIVNGAKTALDAAKTKNTSSAESSIQKGNYKEEPMEIKRTEGDLGYDSEKQPEANEEHQNADYMDQFKDTEMADISEASPEVNNVETAEAKGISGKLDNLFNLVGTASTSEGENKAISNETEGKLDLDNTPGGSTDSSYQGVHLGSAETAPVMSSGSNIPNAPLNIPVEETQQEDKSAEEEKSPLEQAKEAIADNGDIDDKELPFTDTEQAAEDVEDLVQDETKSDEEKEEILEKCLENDGEIDEGEIAEEAGNTEATPEEQPAEEEPTEEQEEDPKAKAKELLDKFLGYAKHDSSSSADSSISSGGAPVEDAMNTQSGGLGDAVAELLGGSAGNATYSSDSVSSNALQAPNPTVNNLESAISQKGASGSVKDISNEVSNASSSSGSGPIAKAFNDIVNGKGLDYASSSGESKFSDALGKGSVGSVGSSNSQSEIGSGKNVEAAFKSNPVAVIKAQVKENFNDWKERDGVSYKAKGSVLVTTENGKDIQVKLGSRRAVPLEKVPEDKLPYVEAVVK